MRIEQDFEVPAAPREVYELLVDLDRVAPCIPGGEGAAKAKMTMAVAASDSRARVESVSDVRISGRAGQMGRGVVDDVAARLVAEMAACIAARFAPPGGGAGAGGGAVEPPARAKPIGGLRLMARVLWERLKRAFRRRGGET